MEQEHIFLYNMVNDTVEQMFSPEWMFMSKASIQEYTVEIIADFRSRNEKILFIRNLRKVIDDRIGGINSLMKKIDKDRYDKFCDISEWLCSLNVENIIGEFSEKDLESKPSAEDWVEEQAANFVDTTKMEIEPQQHLTLDIATESKVLENYHFWQNLTATEGALENKGFTQSPQTEPHARQTVQKNSTEKNLLTQITQIFADNNFFYTPSVLSLENSVLSVCKTIKRSLANE